MLIPDDLARVASRCSLGPQTGADDGAREDASQRVRLHRHLSRGHGGVHARRAEGEPGPAEVRAHIDAIGRSRALSCPV